MGFSSILEYLTDLAEYQYYKRVWDSSVNEERKRIVKVGGETRLNQYGPRLNSTWRQPSNGSTKKVYEQLDLPVAPLTIETLLKWLRGHTLS